MSSFQANDVLTPNMVATLVEKFNPGRRWRNFDFDRLIHDLKSEARAAGFRLFDTKELLDQHLERERQQKELKQSDMMASQTIASSLKKSFVH